MLSYQDKIIEVIIKINNIIKSYCFEVNENGIKMNENIYLKFFDIYDNKITEIFDENMNLGINKILLKKLLKQYYRDKLSKLKNIDKLTKNVKFNEKSDSEIFLDLYITKILDYKELLSLIYPYASQDNFFIYLYQNKEYFFKIYQLLFFIIVIYYLII
jgi:hypothetical protein